MELSTISRRGGAARPARSTRCHHGPLLDGFESLQNLDLVSRIIVGAAIAVALARSYLRGVRLFLRVFCSVRMFHVSGQVLEFMRQV
jgi:hypothetical protein